MTLISRVNVYGCSDCQITVRKGARILGAETGAGPDVGTGFSLIVMDDGLSDLVTRKVAVIPENYTRDYLDDYEYIGWVWIYGVPYHVFMGAEF